MSPSLFQILAQILPRFIQLQPAPLRVIRDLILAAPNPHTAKPNTNSIASSTRSMSSGESVPAC